MPPARVVGVLIFSILCLSILPSPVHAQDESAGQRGFLKNILKKRAEKNKLENRSEEGFYIKGKGQSTNESIGDRSFIVYMPPALPERGKRPVLVVLHGGFGNAAHIQNYIGLDPLADKFGFIVAYLNGTKVARGLPEKMRGWNAGGCCGQPEVNNIDDLGFIKSVIKTLADKYGVDQAQVYGTGHSNGGMMTQRILCETNLYKQGVSISGTLQMDIKTCPAVSGKRITNIHGGQDTNLPVAGGYTKDGFNKKTNYNSQEYSRSVYERSGATYDLILLKDATHSPETINAELWKTQNMSLPRTIVNILGLDK